MKKNYLYSLLFVLFSCSLSINAQENKQQIVTNTPSTIEGLSLYPNPVKDGKVYISTKNDGQKEIIIFDLLGKQVLQTFLSTRELNISNLMPGVYIIKINEQSATATRKLIIR